VNASSGAKGSLTELNNPSSGPLFDAINAFLNDKEPDPAGKPKAYLNWILLDEQLKPVTDNDQTYAMPVVNAGSLNSLGYTGLPISKSGYLYIWVSNETQGWDLFFDNLSVKHYTGPLLEETHYYPFGLTMAGISSKALKPYYAENKYRYNKGSELQDKDFTDGSGLELYDTHFRELDPQLGRWWQIDPKIENDQESTSPYSSMANNPINYNDPNGDCIPCVIVGLEAAGEILTGAVAGAVAYIVGSEVSKKASTIKLDPAQMSGPVGNSSFIAPAFVEMMGTNAQTKTDKVNSSQGGKYSNIPDPKNAGPGKKAPLRKRSKY
jgi:RHS repeat-associated protein